ncbi:PH domain-containing protein [Nonomuraea sp. NPDC050790]|uniref:PH domain-containing protein n=1 Tax=Nonomuraea sp. NPDC050790 TaxID=3364371 RepID=UPI00378E8BDA
MTAPRDQTAQEQSAQEQDAQGQDAQGQDAREHSPREQDVLREQDGWRRLAGRSVAASMVLSVAIVVPVVVVLGRIMLGVDWSFAAVAGVNAVAAIAIVAAVAVYDVLRLRTTRWRLTDERLELRSGIAERRHRSVPRERVRSVDITADPVRRAFGLAVVKIGTGEHTGETKELTLDPLLRPEAETLRRTLLEQERPEGAQAHPAARDTTVARLDWAWIRYAPLSVWTFVGGAIVAGALYKGLDMLGFDLVSGGTLTALWAWATAHPWAAVLAVVGANVLVGVVGALGLFAETWGRYHLEREPGRLRLHRGLLTTRSLTLEERRLRGVEVAEPLLLRLGGGAKVKAVATGLRKAAENETEDVAALTPPMPRELAWRVAAAVHGPGGEPPVLLRHPRAARMRRLRWAVAWVVALAAVVGVLDAVFAWMPVWAWAAPVVALPLALGLAVDAYRGLGHGLGPAHLVTRSGSALRSTVALDRSGIVGWTVRQSFFQRRAGLLTVSATTAAGKGHYDVLDVAQDEGLRTAAAAVPGLLEAFVVRR